jgi:hypothetical protein
VRRFLIDEDGGEQSGGASVAGGSGPSDSGSNSMVKLTDDTGSTAVACWYPSENCGSRIIFEAVRDSLLEKPLNGGFNVGVAILREWLAIARKRDAYSLMHTTIGISQLLGISLDAIVVSDETPPQLDANGRVEMPPPIAAIVKASSAYTATRTSHHGHMGFSCSQDFERDICPVEELYRAWRENKVQAFSIFVHENDFDSIPALVGKLWRGVQGNHVPYMEASTATVRIRRRLGRGGNDAHHAQRLTTQGYEYVPCSLRGAIYVEGDGRKVSLALMFEPKQTTSPALEPLVASGLLAGRLLFHPHPAGAQLKRKPDALYGVPQSALGTLPLGHVMRTAHAGAGSSAHAPAYPTAGAVPMPRIDTPSERHSFSLPVQSPPPILIGAPLAAGGGASVAASPAWPCHGLGASCNDRCTSQGLACSNSHGLACSNSHGLACANSHGLACSNSHGLAYSRTARDADGAGHAQPLAAGSSGPSHSEMAAVTLSELGILLGVGMEDDAREVMENRFDEILSQVEGQGVCAERQMGGASGVRG